MLAINNALREIVVAEATDMTSAITWTNCKQLTDVSIPHIAVLRDGVVLPL